MSWYNLAGVAVVVLSAYFMLLHALNLTDYALNNGAFLFFQLERAWDKYLGDCAGYAYYYALQSAGWNVSAIKKTDLEQYFDACVGEAEGKIRAHFDFGENTTYTWKGGRGEWNVEGSATVHLTFLDTNFTHTFPFKKRVKESSGRILVWNMYTGELEVNDTYP